MIRVEIGVSWAAVAVYAAGCVLGVAGLVFRKRRWLAWVGPVAVAGLAVQAVPIALRWARVGHGPYVNALEVLQASVFTGLVFYSVLHRIRPQVRDASGLVLGLSVILLGWGLMSSPEVQPLPPTFRGPWLVVHIAFAKLAYGSILGASALAASHLIRTRSRPEPGSVGAQAAARLDDLSFRLVAFGFVFIAFMIAAGAIWARDAWGAYWSWDPLETWSLATWVLYGLFLHVRVTWKLRDRTSAAAILALLAASIAAFFLVSGLTRTVHTEFMVR